MDPILIVCTALAILAALGLITYHISPLLKKKGFDPDAVVAKANQAAATVKEAMDTLRPFLDAKTNSVVDTVISAASIGVANAEQLLHVGKLDPEERKDAARGYVLNTLSLLGVEATPEIDMLIDGAIEAGVMEIGHKSK